MRHCRQRSPNDLQSSMKGLPCLLKVWQGQRGLLNAWHGFPSGWRKFPNGLEKRAGQLAEWLDGFMKGVLGTLGSVHGRACTVCWWVARKASYMARIAC